MNPGFFHSTFFPTDFWHVDFWLEFVVVPGMGDRNKRAVSMSLPWMLISPMADSYISLDDRMGMVAVYAIPVWVSADSHTDAEGEWDNETNAYDDDATTYATTSTADVYEILELTFDPPIRTQKFRIWAEGEKGGSTFNPNINLWFYYNAAWTQRLSNAITKGEWVGSVIAPPNDTIELVSGMRIEANTVVDYEYLRLYEFQLLDLDSMFPVAPQGKVDSGLATIPLIKGGLVR